MSKWPPNSSGSPCHGSSHQPHLAQRCLRSSSLGDFRFHAQRRCRCPSAFLPPPLPNSPLAESSGLVRHPHLHMHRSLRCIQGERLDGVRAHDRFGSSSHVLQNGLLTHPQDLDGPLRVAAQRKINAYGQQYADNQNISFLPAIVSTPCRMHGEFLRLLTLFYKPTGRPRRASLQLECHRKTTKRTRSASSARLSSSH